MSLTLAYLLGQLAAGSAVAAPTPSDCAALLANEREAALQLDYQAFDQTEDSGFRILAKARCPREAGDLIEAWIARHGSEQSSPTWHLAQMRAESGQTAEALIAARAVLSKKETPEQPFKWNDYVRAIIAFLEKDRVAFDRHHARVRAAQDLHAGNRMNADFLDRFAARFDGSYLEAVTAGS